MSAREFRGDDTGYLSWLHTHEAGYLINIQKGYNPTDAGPMTTPTSRVSLSGKRSFATRSLRSARTSTRQPTRSYTPRSTATIRRLPRLPSTSIGPST